MYFVKFSNLFSCLFDHSINWLAFLCLVMVGWFSAFTNSSTDFWKLLIAFVRAALVAVQRACLLGKSSPPFYLMKVTEVFMSADLAVPFVNLVSGISDTDYRSQLTNHRPSVPWYPAHTVTSGKNCLK